MLQVSRRHVYEMIREKRIPGIKLGRVVRVPVAEFEEQLRKAEIV